MVQIHQLTLQYRYKLITNVRSSLMAVNIHITIIELNALHTKRQNLFQELDANAWERAGADASSAGMVDAGFENQKELTKMQLDNQKEIAEMQNETQKEIAGIQSATSRQNTKDQVYAQNEMLAYQQKESTARVASIMENTNLSKQQQVSEIM